MRCIITNFWGLLLVFTCAVYSGGWHEGWNFIKQCGVAVDSAMSGLAVIAFQFRDELGITDWFWTQGSYVIIAVFGWAVAGYAFNAKAKKKLLGIIGIVVSIASTILTFS